MEYHLECFFQKTTEIIDIRDCSRVNTQKW